MPSQRKIDIVEKLKEKASRAKGLVFADYQGLTHKQLESLKKELKQIDAELVVTKNTLLVKATDIKEKFESPTATLFAYSDIITPLKALAKTIKLLKLPVVKFGILDGKTITGEEVLRLAALPSREVLLAQLVGGMKAPIYGLHRALSWNIQRLILTIKAIETKGGDKNG